MRTVLILSVIIAAAVACPLIQNKDCSCSLPKICPPTWNIKTFDSQCATLAFQGIWYVQMVSPTYIDGQNPLKTGLFCNSYPCTNNQLIFTDTTQCDDTDFNIEYEMTDSSYNIYTQSIETHKALLCPAYGNKSPYAIFNVGSEKYYSSPLSDKYPFIDDDLYRHKIGNGICEREYTLAVIGADDCWNEYMVLAIINQYENLFYGNDYLIWVLTRDVNPDWSTYDKAYEDIKRSGLTPNCLVSVDHSMGPMTVPSTSVPSTSIPLTSVSSTLPTTVGGINGVTQETTSTTSATKSIVSDCGSSSVTSTSSSTTTTTTSTVIIEKSPDYTIPYDFGQFDLFNPYGNIQILKGLDDSTIKRALSGCYYMTLATPCSFYDIPNSRPGILNNCVPAYGLYLMFDDSINEWDCISPRMVMDCGYDMRNGNLQVTPGYISPAYSKDHPFGSTTYVLNTEEYYEKKIEEIDSLPLDGMICKKRSDKYKTQIIMSIIGYKPDEYLILCIANRYKNPLFANKQIPLIYGYTRDKVPNSATMNSITQEILRCGQEPNKLIKIDQTKTPDTPNAFDRMLFESKVPSPLMANSMVSPRGLNTGNNSPTLPSICPKGWDIKTFDSQQATLAFQGRWYVQMLSPTYIDGQNPLKTGLFCNSYPCTNNQLIFTDTTQCDDTDFNTEYEMTDSSYNIYTQSIETQKALLCPAYGNKSPYAIFNVGSEKYYSSPLSDKYPFIDDNLYRHKIGNGICEREYTLAVIGADDCWNEYMVLAIINQYENLFYGNDYLIWVLTRDVNPDWSTYDKAYKDIKRSGLTPNYLVSVDHSMEPMTVPSTSVPSTSIPLTSVSSTLPTTVGGINGVTQETTSTTSETKSIVNDCGSSSVTSTSSSTTTTTTSTVIIEKSPDYTSLYEFGSCDLYNDIQILKNLDEPTIKSALCGKYYMAYATPCSFYDSPNVRPGILNNCVPAFNIQLIFDTDSINEWDGVSPRMVMDRGYDMTNGNLQVTPGYISPAYSKDHPYGSSTYVLNTEGYYEKKMEEIGSLPLDGMICKKRSDKYKTQIILSIIGYKPDEYLILCIANRYKNPFFNSVQVNPIVVYTRDRFPKSDTIRSITQELLQRRCNPNHLVKVDQSLDITDDYVFETSYYESEISCWSTSSSVSSTSFSTKSESSSVSISYE